MTPSPEGQFEIDQTDKGRYYVRNKATIAQVVGTVRTGQYCSVLGPGYCHKTQLLKDVKNTLESTGTELCVLIDLRHFRSIGAEIFLRAFAEAISREVTGSSDSLKPSSASTVKDAQSLQRFLQELVTERRRDLVLLINRLQQAPAGSLESLFEALRAIHRDIRLDDSYKLGVVTASTLGVAGLTLGDTPPFHTMWVQDLSDEESECLIRHIFAKNRSTISQEGIHRLIDATRGDRYLIPRLSERCATLGPEQTRRSEVEDVNSAIEWFLHSEADAHSPLKETVLALQADPIALLNALDVIEARCVPRNRLRIRGGEDFDGLRLTGAIRVDDKDGELVYCIRNEIYKEYLQKKLFLSWVVDVLRTGGLREEAINYVERHVSGNPSLRPKLLDTILDSIWAAHDEDHACELLAAGLRRTFPVTRLQILLVDPDRRWLRPRPEADPEGDLSIELSLENRERPECKAFETGRPKTNTSDCAPREGVVAFPLMAEVGVFGVATLYDLKASERQEQQQELVAFLQMAARAVAEVLARERRIREFDKAYEKWRQVPTSLDLTQVLTATIHAAMSAVPAAENGSVFLWNEDRQKLVVQASAGFPNQLAETVELNTGEGYVGWAFQNGKPVFLDNVDQDPRTVRAGPIGERSAICVPLEAWGRVIGALCLQNVNQYRAFRRNDVALLLSFASQAALVIQNARLSSELYEIGLRINRSDMDVEQIFEAAVKSIRQVSGAKAANMVLFRSVDDPDRALTLDPERTAFAGLRPDFDVKPRKNGLTAHVLRDPQRTPRFVSIPKPGHKSPPDPRDLTGVVEIPRETWELGIKAYICLPLAIQDTTIGVLFVHYGEAHPFSDNEIRMLSLFANQTALAIQSAQQREKLALTTKVAWIGIFYSDKIHALKTLADLLHQRTTQRLRAQADDDTVKYVEAAEALAQRVLEIPTRYNLPISDHRTEKDLNEVIRDVIRETHDAEQSNDEGSSDLDSTRLCADRLPVMVDSRWLAAFLKLLIKNAKMAVRTSDDKKIRFESRVVHSKAAVSVSNKGTPIPPDTQLLLFREPIPRTGGRSGSGIGSLIARSIIGSYGGDVELERSDENGTVFSFTLPILER